jgi:hypothetical protein
MNVTTLESSMYKRIISKRRLNKYNMRMLNGFIWLNMQTSQQWALVYMMMSSCFSQIVGNVFTS